MKDRIRTGSALTLIELCVTMAIIGGLAGILLSAVFMVRNSARKCQCISTLRQIGMALEMYSSDWQGWMLPEAGGVIRLGTKEQWLAQDFEKSGFPYSLGKLYPAYLVDIEVLFCPACSLRDSELTAWRQGHPFVNCSYMYRGVQGGASAIFSKNSDKALVMQFMRKDRTQGNTIGHDGKSVPILWGDGSARFFDCTLEDVSFNPVTRIEPFLWADLQNK